YHVEHFLAFLHAATSGELASENDLLVRIVDRRIELELAAGALERPAGERARNVDHVLLGVPAVHAEGVELHQLAGVVLVQPLGTTLLQLLHQALALFRGRILQTLARRGRQLASGTRATR